MRLCARSGDRRRNDDDDDKRGVLPLLLLLLLVLQHYIRHRRAATGYVVLANQGCSVTATDESGQSGGPSREDEERDVEGIAGGCNPRVTIWRGRPNHRGAGRVIEERARARVPASVRVL